MDLLKQTGSYVALSVEDEPYDLLLPDGRAADGLATGPHRWPVSIDLTANMAMGEQLEHKGKANISYIGSCEVFVRCLLCRP